MHFNKYTQQRFLLIVNTKAQRINKTQCW